MHVRAAELACRRVSHDTEMASTSGHHILSESEASELFGDYIDEDSQTVQQVTFALASVCCSHNALMAAFM